MHPPVEPTPIKTEPSHHPTKCLCVFQTVLHPQRQPYAHLSPPLNRFASSGTSWAHTVRFCVWRFSISRMCMCVDSSGHVTGDCVPHPHTHSHTQLVHPSSCWWALGSFLFGDITNKAAANIHVQIFPCACALISLENIYKWTYWVRGWACALLYRKPVKLSPKFV